MSGLLYDDNAIASYHFLLGACNSLLFCSDSTQLQPMPCSDACTWVHVFTLALLRFMPIGYNHSCLSQNYVLVIESKDEFKPLNLHVTCNANRTLSRHLNMDMEKAQPHC